MQAQAFAACRTPQRDLTCCQHVALQAGPGTAAICTLTPAAATRATPALPANRRAGGGAGTRYAPRKRHNPRPA
jgi:hypothetical protein